MRLQKYIARSGLTSRRKAEELILQGRVEVDGQVVKELGTKVGMDNLVKVDGKIIRVEEVKRYIALNKPRGYVTTLDDEFSREIVVDLIKDVEERVYPVGRLDLDTEGLLILTNDGDLTFKLTHPSFEIEKTYIALVNGIPNENELESFRQGLLIEGKMTYPAKVKLLKTHGKNAELEVKIHEGRNRQVRKMCDAINHSVISLKRVQFGPIKLGKLALGEYRYLTKDEIEELKR